VTFGSKIKWTPVRVIYPELPDALTPEDLHRLFSPSHDERQWARTVARALASQVALLVQLKIFQTIGRFRRAAEIPTIVFEPADSARNPGPRSFIQTEHCTGTVRQS
jgi:hypothetical protein